MTIEIAGSVSDFAVVSGDESLVPDIKDSAVIAVHPTPLGYWLVDRANGVLPAGVTVGDCTIGGGGPLWCAAGSCVLDDAVRTGLRLKRAQRRPDWTGRRR